MWKIISLGFAFVLISAPAIADEALKGGPEDKDAGTVEDILQSPAEDTLNAPADEVLDAPLEEDTQQQETVVPEDGQESATQETTVPLEEGQDTGLDAEQESESMEESEDQGMF